MNPVMEEDQDQEQNKTKKNNKQHVCKFCCRSFPCGRSLGGHMRSHVINASSSSAAETDHREKLLLAASADYEAGYGLRENPKKTWRLYSSEEEHTLFLDKICKECGKGFPSWKSLFGHMKCHSEKERSVSNNNSNNTNSFFYDQVQDSSWNNTNTDDDDDSVQKLVFDNESDNEGTNTPPNRRKRSKRIRSRYMVAPLPPPSTTSFSEVEQDEVVAMSLMMLSKDVGYWGGINSVLDNNKNNNNLLDFDVPSSVIEGKKNNKLLVTNRSDFATKLTKPKGGKSSEIFSDSTNHHKYTSIKAKFLDSKAEFSKISHQNKRVKFECTTCYKIFHSYQALGGHRASHKKIKGCFASRNYEGSENITEFEEPDPSSIITDPTTTTAAETSKNKHIIKKKKCDTNNNESYILEQHEEKEAVVYETESKNKGKGFHECPICLRVFTSGQALGGHKRSHMANNGGSVEGGKTCQSQRVVLHESVPEIRDFLDLNLPADTGAVTEEKISNNSSHHVDVNYRPWWVVGGGNHKQEALVGLISN